MHFGIMKVWSEVTRGQKKMRRSKSTKEAQLERPARLSPLSYTYLKLSTFLACIPWSLRTTQVICLLTIIQGMIATHQRMLAPAYLPSRQNWLETNVMMMVLRVRVAVRERVHVTLELIISWTNEQCL